MLAESLLIKKDWNEIASRLTELRKGSKIG